MTNQNKLKQYQQKDQQNITQINLAFLMKKNIFLGIFQNYLVFILAIKNIIYFLALLGLNRGNLMEYQKKVLKI